MNVCSYFIQEDEERVFLGENASLNRSLFKQRLALGSVHRRGFNWFRENESNLS